MVSHLDDDRARRLLSLALIGGIIAIAIVASRHRPALIPAAPLVTFSKDQSRHAQGGGVPTLAAAE